MQWQSWNGRVEQEEKVENNQKRETPACQAGSHKQKGDISK